MIDRIRRITQGAVALLTTTSAAIAADPDTRLDTSGNLARRANPVAETLHLAKVIGQGGSSAASCRFRG